MVAMTVEYVSNKVMQNLVRLDFETKGGFKHAKYDTMRLWLNNMMKFLPPKSGKQGKDAVKRDIQQLFYGVENKGVMEFFAEDMKPHLPTSVIMNRDGNMNRMKTWHKRHRDKRGRVQFHKRVVATVGKWQFVNGMYIPKRVLNKYIRATIKKVGTLKAGFIRASEYYAGKSKGKARIPAFVRKQTNAGGRYKDRLRKSGGGSVSATNTVPWAAASRPMREAVKITERIAKRFLIKKTKIMAREAARAFNRR